MTRRDYASRPDDKDSFWAPTGIDMIVRIRFNTQQIDSKTLLDEVGDIIRERHPDANGIRVSLSRDSHNEPG